MEFSCRMEEELKCVICRRLYINPVILPRCLHSICLDCAVKMEMPLPMPLVSTSALLLNTNTNCQSSNFTKSNLDASPPPPKKPDESGSNMHLQIFMGQLNECAYNDVDEMSTLSETDSGVVLGSSRPDSLVMLTGLTGHPLQPHHPPYSSNSCQSTLNRGQLMSSSFVPGNGKVAKAALTCPICSNYILLDERGAKGLNKAHCLTTIVERYRENKELATPCQICPSTHKLNPATGFCTQCEIFYCDKCLSNFHSKSDHNILKMSDARKLLLQRDNRKFVDGGFFCVEHPGEVLSAICICCGNFGCERCGQDVANQHGCTQDHRLLSFAAASKIQKTELKQLLQSLSENAKTETEQLTKLKSIQDQLEANVGSFEASVMDQCDELIEAIHSHKKYLSALLLQHKNIRLQNLKELMIQHSANIHKATGLIQFSIEALKEVEPQDFLLISPTLQKRITNASNGLNSELDHEIASVHNFDWRFDINNALKSIQSLSFTQVKVPGSPKIMTRKCVVEGNTLTLVWEPSAIESSLDGYVLEIDDGNLGNFRQVFTGKEQICTIEGLHFDTKYRTRVKAFNASGDGPYSQCLSLQTAKVAWFTFDTQNLLSEVVITNSNKTVTSQCLDDRVVIATQGFVKGVHYWEVVVDKYENNKDPAFGIARREVSRDKMLGKDANGWSMYVDKTRSWFLHDGQHTGRTSGGIEAGSVVGCLLDLDRQAVSFYIDGLQHGPIAFPCLPAGSTAAYYPAVSVNKNVQLTLRSGLELPVDIDNYDST